MSVVETNLKCGRVATMSKTFERNKNNNSSSSSVGKILVNHRPRKLTKANVFFGQVNIVVPILSDEMTVEQLIHYAVTRFSRIDPQDTAENYHNSTMDCNSGNNKSTFPTLQRHVEKPDVKYLQTLTGAILYAGDKLSAVIDDKEQLTAIYDQPQSSTIILNGNLTSQISYNNSNVCNIEIADPIVVPPTGKKMHENYTSDNDPTVFSHTVEVKNLDDIPASTSSLIVRRESEPAYEHGKSLRASLVRHDESRKLNPSPSRGVVKWKDEQIDGALDRTKDRKSTSGRFKRNEARKSRVTDEMLDFAARLAEKSWQESEETKRFSGTETDTRFRTMDPSNEPASSSLHFERPIDAPTIEGVKGHEVAQTSSSSNTTLPVPSHLSELQKGNTRRLGRSILVKLEKGSDGLGFTVSSRDNAQDGRNFTCVKNILPDGVARKDGKLREGDRLLKINGLDVSDYARDKIVNILKAVGPGETVSMIVSRQEIDNEPADSDPAVPEKSTEERSVPTSGDYWPFPGAERRLLTFDIALNDSGSAGLGVSVKGRTRRVKCGRSVDGDDEVEQSCGIFVNLIIHGGAAHKDGRLLVNDQLVAVNQVDLTGVSNSKAMLILRETMQRLDPSATSIQLSVLRCHSLTGGGSTASSSSDGRQQHLSSSAGARDTPDGRASLLLETPRLEQQPAKAPMERMTIAGYGDYALIVKQSNGLNSLSAPTLSQLPHLEDRVIIEDDNNRYHRHHLSDHVDIASEISTNYEDSFLGVAEDPFVRDSRSRQSMSEKRRGASKIDPSQTALYQQIMHQRQTSAPSLVDSKQDGVNVKIDTSDQQHRLACSLESVSTASVAVAPLKRDKIASKPLLHEQVAMQAFLKQTAHPESPKTKSDRKSRQRHTYLNADPQQRNTMFEVSRGSAFYGPNRQEHSLPFDNPCHSGDSSSTSDPHHPLNLKDLKIAGGSTRRRPAVLQQSFTTLKNLFRFGSTGKSNKKFSVSNEKCSPCSPCHSMDAETAELSRRKAEEEQKRIRMYYERLKEQQRRQVQSCIESSSGENRQYDIGGQTGQNRRPSQPTDYDYLGRSGTHAQWISRGFVAYPQPVPPSSKTRPFNRYEIDYYDDPRHLERDQYGPGFYQTPDQQTPSSKTGSEFYHTRTAHHPEPVPDYPEASAYFNRPPPGHPDSMSGHGIPPAAAMFSWSNGNYATICRHPVAERRSVLRDAAPPPPPIPPPDYEEYLRRGYGGKRDSSCDRTRRNPYYQHANNRPVSDMVQPDDRFYAGKSGDEYYGHVTKIHF